MGTDEPGKVERPYPLADHLLAILDTPSPYIVLISELSRYTRWMMEAEAQLGKVYGAERALPTKRLDTPWDEQDMGYMRLAIRQDILSNILQAVGFEQAILEECESCENIQTCVQLLVEVLEQLEELPCLEERVAPRGIASFKVSPPMQRLASEIKNMAKKVAHEENATLRELHEIKYHLFEKVLERWTREHVLEAVLQDVGRVKYIHSHPWTIVVLDGK